MKTLTLVILALSLSACGTISNFTPGVTSKMFNKAADVCKSEGGVHMVTQTFGKDYDAFCANGKKHQL